MSTLLIALSGRVDRPSPQDVVGDALAGGTMARVAVRYLPGVNCRKGQRLREWEAEGSFQAEFGWEENSMQEQEVKWSDIQGKFRNVSKNLHGIVLAQNRLANEIDDALHTVDEMIDRLWEQIDELEGQLGLCAATLEIVLGDVLPAAEKVPGPAIVEPTHILRDE